MILFCFCSEQELLARQDLLSKQEHLSKHLVSAIFGDFGSHQSAISTKYFIIYFCLNRSPCSNRSSCACPQQKLLLLSRTGAWKVLLLLLLLKQNTSAGAQELRCSGRSLLLYNFSTLHSYLQMLSLSLQWQM